MCDIFQILSSIENKQQYFSDYFQNWLIYIHFAKFICTETID